MLVDLARVAGGVGLDMLVISIMCSDDSPYAAQLVDLGVEVVDLARTGRWDPRALALAVRVLRRWQPDVIHSHLKHADMVGAFAARRLGVPLVSTLHIIEDRTGPLGRFKRHTAAVARMSTAARTVAVSEAQRRWYVATFRVDPGSVVTVHNGVQDVTGLSPGQRSALRSSLGVDPDTALCLNVGIMRPGKGQADLLTALSLLPEDLPLRVVLVGDGPLRPALEAQAAAAGLLPARVHFAGFRRDVGALLVAGDLVVSTSWSEALPTVLLQALAAGRATVATEVGGVPEVVTAEEAILVPVRDAQQLAGALRTLALDGELRSRLGVAARARFEDRFTVLQWAQRLHVLYLDVLTRQPRGR